jgi:uncharacterized damage-inducible protein DinB
MIAAAETIGATGSLEYLVQNYAQYNLWANATLVHWLRTKATHLIETEVASSFSSIRQTLLHILDTQNYWFSVISGQTTIDADTSVLTTDDLLSEFIDHSAQVAEYVAAMSRSDIRDQTLVSSPWFECNFANFEYVMQLVNHSTYHRGQIVTMGRQLGFTDAPNTDYNYFNVRGK